MGAIEELAELFDVPESRVVFLKSVGLHDFRVKGKLPGILSKKYAVEPSGKRFTVIVKENVLENLKEDTKELFDLASKLPGKVVVDTTSGKVFVEDGDTKLEAGKGKIAGVTSVQNIGKLINVISIVSSRIGEDLGTLISTLRELEKGTHIVNQFLKNSRIYVDDSNVFVVLPSGLAVKIKPDDAVGWRPLTAKLVAVMVENGVMSREDVAKISDAEVRKLAKGILDSGVFDRIFSVI